MNSYPPYLASPFFTFELINRSKLKRGLFLSMLFLGLVNLSAQWKLEQLRTEYLENPIGIDEPSPRFSWQMVAETEKRGLSQNGFQVRVWAETGQLVWDTGRIETGESQQIPYAGESLQPRTDYRWELRVWDSKNQLRQAVAKFSTGLLSADPQNVQWHGADWIGGGDKDIPFYAHALSVFKLDYELTLDQESTSEKASFILGGNDRRLLKKNLNIQGVAQGMDESYIRFELDISKLEKDQGNARFNVYRVGYAPEDQDSLPFRSFKISRKLIDWENRYERHKIALKCVFGFFEVFVNGKDSEHLVSTNDDSLPPPRGKVGFNLNPVGRGNDYISFPMIGDIGFYAGPGQKAHFNNIRIGNYREPSKNLFFEKPDVTQPYNGPFLKELLGNPLFNLSRDSYVLQGGELGNLVLVDPSNNGMPMLRTTFNPAKKPIRKARIYATARGIYELYLNGRRVGDSYFSPGLTQYNRTHMYQTYDVTDLIADSGNAWGVWLAEGWWSGNITYSGENWNFFGDRPSFKGQLIITYEDGSEEVVISNPEDWSINTQGPILSGSFFQGEVYDARREAHVAGWSTYDFEEKNWQKAQRVSLDGTTFPGLDYESLELRAQLGENPKIVKTLIAQEVEEVRPGIFVYDMGQNMVGFPRIELPEGQAGDSLILRYAEVKYPNLEVYGEQVGMVMMENIRAALAHDLYIRKGGSEVINPRFTFHGYRYVEITGLQEALPLERVQGKVVSSIESLASSYQTSNPLVNQLWSNISWSLRGNFLSIPTDTPARNERMGWSGDINVFSATAVFMADVAPFLNRHLIAMRDIQREDGRFTDVAPVGGGFGGTLWGSAGMVIPWKLYQQYGDLRVLKAHYGAMKRYMEFLTSRIDPDTGYLIEGPLGDWLSPEAYKNDDTLFWATYHLYGLEILIKSAELLGYTEDIGPLRAEYAQRKAYLNQTYFDGESGKSIHRGNRALRFGPPLPADMVPEEGDLMDTQASYAIPIHLGVLDKALQEKAVENLVHTLERENLDELQVMRPEYSLMTGFIGTASLSHALAANEKHKEVYTLLQQTSYPSWLYSVVNGATTIWERLNSYTVENGFGGNNSMNSFNHYSFGAIASWMYNYSLGIQVDPEQPGYKHFLLKPIPDPTGKMTWARGHYDAPYGRIESAWKTTESGWNYRVIVPANTTATLFLRANSPDNVMEGSKKLKRVKDLQLAGQTGDYLKLELSSGTYSFEIRE